MKKFRFNLLAAAGMGLLSLASCNNNDDEGIIIDRLPETRSINLTDEQKEMLQHNNQFALDLFREVYARNGNHSLAFAPMGATYMLGMVSNGASDKARQEIASAMGFGREGAEGVNLLCQRLIEDAPKTDVSVRLEIANAVFSRKGYELDEAFKRTVKTYYGAQAETMDFADSKALDRINGWAKNKTHGKLDKLLDKIDPNAVAYLLNAIFFEAGWTDKFDKKKTQEQDFTKENGDLERVQMMRSKSLVRYAENADCQMVRLPYGGSEEKGESWNMYLILPKEGKTVKDVLDVLDGNAWNALRRAEESIVLELQIPKFHIMSTTDLVTALPGLGVKRIFNEAGSMNNMFKNAENTLVNKMWQQSGIEVNEDGCKMISVTISEILDGAPNYPHPDIQFHANHPFIYVVSEKSSDAIFFTGVFHGN